jgi:hypothetical protein
MFFVLVKECEGKTVFYPRANLRATGRTVTSDLQEAELFTCKLEQVRGPDGFCTAEVSLWLRSALPAQPGPTQEDP